MRAWPLKTSDNTVPSLKRQKRGQGTGLANATGGWAAKLVMQGSTSGKQLKDKGSIGSHDVGRCLQGGLARLGTLDNRKYADITYSLKGGIPDSSE